MIGVIGFGRFGRLATRYLSEYFPVFVHDPAAPATAVAAAGGEAVPFDVACRQDAVLLCVPISQLRPVLDAMATAAVSPPTLVVDVCSVKSLPVAWMRERLPKGVEFLATHPMFGPDSAAGTLVGKKIAICSGRVAPERYRCIHAYLKKRGLSIIETTPEDHDRQIAVTLALTHFIGRGLERFGAADYPIDTEGYQRLRHILGVVGNDTWQLFEDMHRFNPYAADARRRFLAAMAELDESLQDGDPQIL